MTIATAEAISDAYIESARSGTDAAEVVKVKQKCTVSLYVAGLMAADGAPSRSGRRNLTKNQCAHFEFLP